MNEGTHATNQRRPTPGKQAGFSGFRCKNKRQMEK